MWNLESAREDYNRTVPDCERCKFRNGLILGYGSPLVKCLVKSDNYERHDAKTCKYYTWEGERKVVEFNKLTMEP